MVVLRFPALLSLFTLALSQSWSCLSHLVTMLGSTSLLCQQLHSQLTDTQSQLDTAHQKAQELRQLRKVVSQFSLKLIM